MIYEERHSSTKAGIQTIINTLFFVALFGSVYVIIVLSHINEGLYDWHDGITGTVFILSITIGIGGCIIWFLIWGIKGGILEINSSNDYCISINGDILSCQFPSEEIGQSFELKLKEICSIRKETTYGADGDKFDYWSIYLLCGETVDLKPTLFNYNSLKEALISTEHAIRYEEIDKGSEKVYFDEVNKKNLTNEFPIRKIKVIRDNFWHLVAMFGLGILLLFIVIWEGGITNAILSRDAGIIILPALTLVTYFILIASDAMSWFRAVKSIKYFTDGNNLMFKQGNEERIIPYSRINELKINQFFIDQLFGLYNLTITTEFSSHSTAKIFGLNKNDSEELKELIQDLMIKHNNVNCIVKNKN